MPNDFQPAVEQRLKAVAQSLKLLTHHSQENFDMLFRVINALAEAQVKTEGAIASLLRIAESHEHRLDQLES